jgi:hypothetical protein
MADNPRKASGLSNANTPQARIDPASLDVFRSPGGAAAGAAEASGERAGLTPGTPIEPANRASSGGRDTEAEPDPATAIPVVSADSASIGDRRQGNEADGTTATSIPVADFGSTSQQSEAAAEERSTEIPIAPMDATAVGDRGFVDARFPSDGRESTGAAVTAEDREDSVTPGISFGGSDSRTSNDMLAGSDEPAPEPSDRDDQSQNPNPAITVGGSDSSPSDFNMLTGAEESPRDEVSTGGDRDRGTGEGQTGRGDASERPPSGRGSVDTFEALEIGTVPAQFQNPPASIRSGTPTGATTAGADTGVAGAVPITAVSGPPPVEETPVDGPSLIPGRSSILGDRMAGESAPGTLAPEVVPGSALDDQIGVDLPTGGSGAGSNPFGGGRLDLPGAPVAEELGGGHVLDAGIDFNNLTGTGTLDGRGVDAFDGVGLDTGASGPADTGGMTSDGGSKGSPFTTSGPGLFSSTKAAEKAVDDAIAGMKAGTKPNPYITIQEVQLGSVIDVPVADTAEAPAATESSKSHAEQKNEQWKFIGDDVPPDGHADGGLPGQVGKTTVLESFIALFNDDLPPDHPDYAGGGEERSPGSALDDSIRQSILIGLGGQRGGDVDPYDDPAGTTTGGAVQIDAYDSVVDPGPDGFMSTVDVDRSMLGGPMDAVAPELSEE